MGKQAKDLEFWRAVVFVQVKQMMVLRPHEPLVLVLLLLPCFDKDLIGYALRLRAVQQPAAEE